MRGQCLAADLSDADLVLVDNALVAGLRKVARGTPLFRAGDPFDTLFPIWTGFFKTVVGSDQGLEQVTGFHMVGELLGLGGIDTGRHEVDAIALEDSQVCVVPYAGLGTLLRQSSTLQRHFHRVMSREIAADHLAMLQLGSMHAEERLAAFLLNLMQRLQARGFSESSVLLRMSREEIGSYLGLKLETVSRTFSKFQATGLLSVQQRAIHVTDLIGLQQVLAPPQSDAG
ncbi:MAG: helix-turn-helix domain-containing protein [Caldimonas sp.]